MQHKLNVQCKLRISDPSIPDPYLENGRIQVFFDDRIQFLFCSLKNRIRVDSSRNPSLERGFCSSLANVLKLT